MNIKNVKANKLVSKIVVHVLPPFFRIDTTKCIEFCEETTKKYLLHRSKWSFRISGLNAAGLAGAEENSVKSVKIF